MSAWTIYWVLQLDSIRSLFQAATGLTVFAMCGSLMIAVASATVDEAGFGKRCLAFFWKLLIPASIAASLCAVTPSSKTMAAIIIVPKIATEENLQAIGGDAKLLYKAGVARLLEVLGEAPKEPTK